MHNYLKNIDHEEFCNIMSSIKDKTIQISFDGVVSFKRSYNYFDFVYDDIQYSFGETEAFTYEFDLKYDNVKSIFKEDIPEDDECIYIYLIDGSIVNIIT